MSSAGHVIDAIKRQKENRKLQKQNRKDTPSKYSYNSANKEFNSAKFQPKSKEEAEAGRKKIYKTMRKESAIAWGKTIFTLVILFILLEVTSVGERFVSFFKMLFIEL
jgi:hypothetical protein